MKTVNWATGNRLQAAGDRLQATGLNKNFLIYPVFFSGIKNSNSDFL